VAIAHLSPDGAILRANERLRHLIGGSEKDRRPSALRDLLELEPSAPQLRSTRLLADDVRRDVWLARLRTADGSLVPVRVTLDAVTDPDGDFVVAEIEVRGIVTAAPNEATVTKDATRVERILESISDAFVAIDREWRFTYVNRRAAQLMRRSATELIGKSVWATFPSVLGSRFQAECRRAIRDDVPVQFEELYVPLSVWVGVSIYPGKDGLSVYFQDISERKRVEAALLESERRYRSLVASSSQLVWTADARGRVEDIPAWRELTGQTRSEVRDWGWIDAIHPADREATRQMWITAVRAGAPCQSLYRVRTKEGTHRYFFHRGVPVKDDTGAVCEWVGTCADITERKLADEWRAFLADASRMLGSSLDVETTLTNIARLAVSSLADYCIVYLVNEDGSLRAHDAVHNDPAKADALRAMIERFPLDPRRDDHPVSIVLRTGDASVQPVVTEEMLRRVARNDDHFALLRELGTTSGLNIPLVARGATIGAVAMRRTDPFRRYADSDLTYAQELATRAAQALDNALLYRAARDARREAEGARAEAERLRAAAEGANLAKSEFLAVMSHELRTPLNAISGYADLLEMGVRGDVNDAQQEDLRRIKRSGSHLLGLINEILNFARVEAGRAQLEPRYVSVNEALIGAEALVAPQVHTKELSFERVPCDASLTMFADRERVQQVLLNLLSNAVKFTDHGGRITIRAHAYGDTLAIDVSDTGRGIPEDKLDVIFEPFVQIDRRLTREQEGVGLGLAISRELARAMGGDLAVTSELGVGSTFTLSLPASGPLHGVGD
jgi:PAS domain S-box-containing protein